MKKILLGLVAGFLFTTSSLGFVNEAHAGILSGKSLSNISGECLYDVDFDIRNLSGSVDIFGIFGWGGMSKTFGKKTKYPERPVFDGPGIKEGAKLVRCDIDSGISRVTDLRGLVMGWLQFFLGFVAVMAVVALVWAGFLYVTSFGDDGRAETAKKIIVWVVIGILLILGAYAIVNTVMQARFGV